MGSQWKMHTTPDNQAQVVLSSAPAKSRLEFISRFYLICYSVICLLKDLHIFIVYVIKNSYIRKTCFKIAILSHICAQVH